jgi:CubicO group peptidase (beta-lactamase class C family)
MDKWLKAATDYIPQWLDYQMRQSELPGCTVALAHKGDIVLEAAFGSADLRQGTTLTPRHRFRVASHSKSFTAAGIMALREAGTLRLDDPVGQHVTGLHRSVARVTLGQLLSHSAGIIRDGTDSGQWQDRRPFLNACELRAALAAPPTIEANTRFKYSNHGYGLLGLVIEAVTGEPYGAWIKRTIVTPAGLRETEPDMPAVKRGSLASGHSSRLPLGRRVIIPGTNATNALAPATGFVSTARDLARFFAQLDPASKRSVLSVASRREMIRAQWRTPQFDLVRHYGLGIASGKVGDWDTFGHGGSFQGFITVTMVMPERGLVLAVLTNSSDGLAGPWATGIIHILRGFARHGSPAPRLRDWTGRWWGLWGALDLLPMGRTVVVATPGFWNPMMDASEISVTAKDRGRITRATGFGSYGEDVRLIRGRNRKVVGLQFGGSRLLPEPEVVVEIKRRYRS